MATQLQNGLRGRGRGGQHSNASSRKPSAPASSTAATKTELSSNEGPDGALRKKYAEKVSLAKELFPDWADDDLLTAINDANGDLETALIRIAEGHATQWSAATKKKPKREGESAPPSFAGAGRGRGDGTRGGRGGRGGRGARGGGAGSAGRGGSRANGDSYIGGGGYGKSNGDTTATTTAATWGDAVTTDTSASWADDTPSAVDAPSTDNAGADWGDEPKAEATGGDAGWGAEPAATSTEASSRAGWGDAAPAKASVPRAAAVKMPTKPKLIQPGSKISWAQIAKPAEPPKPAPPPPAMVEQPPPAQAEPPVPVVDIPSENVVEQIAAATSHNVDPWASTPAAATEPWEARPIGGVGEGWAETVLAADSEPSSDVSAPGPAAGVDPAGPLEVTPGVQDQPSHPITANLEAQAAQQHPQEAVNKPLSSVIGPPGLTKRGSQRNHQDAAVVMPNDLRSPGSGALEHANMQFGSLALFDSRTVAGEHLQQEDTTGKIEQEAPQTQPHRPQESSYAATAASQVLAPEQRTSAYEHQQMQEKAPLGPPGQQAAPQQAPQQHQAPQQQHPYGAYAHYGYQDPHSAYNASPYASLGGDSHYGQPQQQQQSTPAQQAPAQPQQPSYSAPGPHAPSPYQPFGSTQDYGAASAQQPQSSLPDSQRSAQSSYYEQFARHGYPGQAAEESKPSAPPTSQAAPAAQQGVPGYPGMYGGYPYNYYQQPPQQPSYPGYPYASYPGQQSLNQGLYGTAQSHYGQPQPQQAAYANYYGYGQQQQQPQRSGSYPQPPGSQATSTTPSVGGGSYGGGSQSATSRATSAYSQAPSPYYAAAASGYPGQPQGPTGGQQDSSTYGKSAGSAFYGQ